MANRTQPNRLTAQAAAEGLSVIELIARALKSEGSQLAASRALGVTPNAIRYHMKKAGLVADMQITLVPVAGAQS